MHSLHTDHPIFASLPSSLCPCKTCLVNADLQFRFEQRKNGGKESLYTISSKNEKDNNNKLQNESIYPKEPAEKKKRKEKFPFIRKGKRNRTRKARIVTPTQENRKRKAPISREIIEVVRAAYLSSVRVRSSLPYRRSRSWRLLSRRATPTLVSRPT